MVETVYKAKNGKLFDNEADAIAYENDDIYKDEFIKILEMTAINISPNGRPFTMLSDIWDVRYELIQFFIDKGYVKKID